MEKIKIGLLGLGRIGIMHAHNVSLMPEFEIVMGADINLDPEMEAKAKENGVPLCTADPDELIANKEIDAVLIATVTGAHSELIQKAARAGKDIFCEKPIDHDVPRILEDLRVVKECGVILQIGFNHRFDKHHGALAKAVHDGVIGPLEVLKITSRDPAPPSMDYIRSSGGIWVDFMIHDFDMARFISQSEVTEIYATGTTVSDPEIAENGDVGSGHAIVKFENGAIGVLESTRRANFGHDQRIEAQGAKGMVIDDNVPDSNVLTYTERGYHSDIIPWHFPERYHDAYINELQQFANCVRERSTPPVTGFDGLQAVLLAEAAARSAKSGKAEPVERIEV